MFVGVPNGPSVPEFSNGIAIALKVAVDNDLVGRYVVEDDMAFDVQAAAAGIELLATATKVGEVSEVIHDALDLTHISVALGCAPLSSRIATDPAQIGHGFFADYEPMVGRHR